MNPAVPPAVVLWLGIAILCGILEIFTVGFYFLFFAGGALITALAAIFVDSLIGQVLIFVLSSLLMVLYARPIVRGAFNVGDKPLKKSNVKALIGQEVIVTEPVDRYRGKVKLTGAGEIWTAYLAEAKEGESLPEGSVAEIVNVDGAKLVIRPR